MLHNTRENDVRRFRQAHPNFEMKSLGRKPEGARLERIKASPMWEGDRFRNVQPIIPGLRDPKASMPTIKEFLCEGIGACHVERCHR